ncbi:histidine phosphatase family protein [Pseudonocardia endophytica]|uniref:Putative phosphoglycerate mutase n=1 Tax=Pseudonocardia endophytica TaxID=401976 RepID=A0A4R1HQU7_PSEEN|nr:histidine phosphatase family protein [Pseudonocardia endophytica]TCK24947.1 putative phosphoglycerate mutase [Pseudonocardia endophytica]
MLLILVRHAEPERLVDAPDGRADPGLTTRGGEQAVRLVDALDGVAIDALVTSSMRRAKDTAAPLAAARGVEPDVVDDLREYDADRDSYVPVSAMAAERPDDWERMRAGHLPAHVDAEAFTARAVAAVDGVVAAHPGHATAVVVAHAGVVNAYLSAALGIPVPLPFPLDYVGVTRVLCSRSGRRRVRTVNEVAHVADLLGDGPPAG